MSQDNKSYALIIEESEIIKEYNFTAYKFIDTQVGIVFHVKGGYDLVIRPRMQALYQHLRQLLDAYDNFEQLSVEEKQVFSSTLSATVVNLEIPLFMACNDAHLFTIASTAIECLNEASEEAFDKTLGAETPDENGKFEARIAAEEMLNEAANAESESQQ